jgi:hypothetical protein
VFIIEMRHFFSKFEPTLFQWNSTCMTSTNWQEHSELESGCWDHNVPGKVLPKRLRVTQFQQWSQKPNLPKSPPLPEQIQDSKIVTARNVGNWIKQLPRF